MYGKISIRDESEETSMKLYFYVFEDNKINFTECEVEEKPKSYTLLEKAYGFYGSRVLKSEIGLKCEYIWKQIVILDKRDDEIAKRYLSDYVNNEIEKKQKEIEKFQKQIEIITEWRSDNE